MPEVMMVPLLVSVFPLPPPKTSMAVELSPAVVIVPVTLFRTLLLFPIENMPSDWTPDVVIVPPLTIVLLLSIHHSALSGPWWAYDWLRPPAQSLFRKKRSSPSIMPHAKKHSRVSGYS